MDPPRGGGGMNLYASGKVEITVPEAAGCDPIFC